jgi:hypothetical protein
VVLLHHTNKGGKQMGTTSKLFNLNTALILKKTFPNQRNHKGKGIVSFGIKVEKQRAKGTGLGDYTFTCEDGIWLYTKKKQNTDLNEDSKSLYSSLLLLDGLIKKQSDIGKLVGCNSTYVSQVKKDPKYKHLFNTDGTPTDDEQGFLDKNRDTLISFYDQKGLNAR